MARYTAEDASLAYEVQGPTKSAYPTLLTVHGFPLDGSMWEKVIPGLVREMRVINPDLRGFGASQATRKASMGRYADDLALLLDLVGEKRPVIIMGLSMGGYIAFEFMRRHGQRLAGAVLADTRTEGDSDEAKKGRIADAERVLREGPRFLAEKMMPKVFGAGLAEAEKKKWLERMAGQASEGVAAALHAIAERPDSAETYRGFARPSVVIAGSEDAITPAAGNRAMAGLNAKATYVEIAGSGHVPPVEKPEEFVQAALRFVRETNW